MTQEHKELLIQDLCARLPYKVKCKYYDCCESNYNEGEICGFERKDYVQVDGVCVHIEEVKPYLFPLSSMTEEQRTSHNFLKHSAYANPIKLIDWYIKNHFDFRGLIPKNLAINAFGLNIY